MSISDSLRTAAKNLRGQRELSESYASASPTRWAEQIMREVTHGNWPSCQYAFGSYMFSFWAGAPDSMKEETARVLRSYGNDVHYKDLDVGRIQVTSKKKDKKKKKWPVKEPWKLPKQREKGMTQGPVPSGSSIPGGGGAPSQGGGMGAVARIPTKHASLKQIVAYAANVIAQIEKEYGGQHD